MEKEKILQIIGFGFDVKMRCEEGRVYIDLHEGVIYLYKFGETLIKIPMISSVKSMMITKADKLADWIDIRCLDGHHPYLIIESLGEMGKEDEPPFINLTETQAVLMMNILQKGVENELSIKEFEKWKN